MNQLIVNSAIARGLDVIGDRWSLLILRDAFLGHCRFDEFRRLSGVSKATLSRRLDRKVSFLRAGMHRPSFTTLPC